MPCAEREAKFEDLVRYLDMARKASTASASSTSSNVNRLIDSALVYAYAQCGRLADLETFISSPNTADIQSAADRCFDEALYEAARILYASASNYPKLASTLVALALYKEAVEAGRKANSIRTWKEISAACLKAGEFPLAKTAGLFIIISPDALEELIAIYVDLGLSEQLISLLEEGSTLEAAHAGIYTELCVAYSRYRPEKLMEAVRLYHKRLNISKVLRACEAARQWLEVRFLLCDVDQPDYDQGVRVMMDHPDAFDQTKLFEVIVKVRNQELFYSALTFVSEECPDALAKMLVTLTSTGKLDHARVVHQFKKAANGETMPLLLPYLKAVQASTTAPGATTIPAVNEALNSLLIDEEDTAGLRESIAAAGDGGFDGAALADRLAKHELLEMRRIAALLYKKGKRWESAIALSKKDAQYKDAIGAAAESGDSALAEGLLTYFVDTAKDKESFAAMLFACYGLLRPDVVVEAAWRARLSDYAVPYMLQYLRDTGARISALEKKVAAKEGAGHAAATGAGDEVGSVPGFMHPTGMLALTNEAYNPTHVPTMGGMMGIGGGMAPPMPQMAGPFAGAGVPMMGGMMPPMPPQGGYGGY